MASFRAWFESIQIRDTRSKHEDTDHAMIAVSIGSKTLNSPVKSLGDLNNGLHPVELALDFELADDVKDPVRLAISVVNSGRSGDQLNQMTQALGPAIAQSATDDQAKQELIKAIVNFVGGLLNANCDGPVVTATATVQPEILRKLGLGYPNCLHLLHGTDYGSDSASGCGHNSNYGYSAVIIRNS